MCFFMRQWKSMKLWKDMLFKVMALFGKLQEAWLSQENILALWQFPLYGSSARNLPCFCTNNLQLLCAFFPLPRNTCWRRTWYVGQKRPKTPLDSVWSRICWFSKVNWKIPGISVFLSRFTAVFIMIIPLYPSFFSLLICWALLSVYVSVGLFRNNPVCHHPFAPYTPWECFLYVPDTLGTVGG